MKITVNPESYTCRKYPSGMEDKLKHFLMKESKEFVTCRYTLKECLKRIVKKRGNDKRTLGHWEERTQ